MMSRYVFSLMELLELRRGLLELLENGPIESSYGVCYNLRKATRSADAYEFVEAVAWSWPRAIRDDHGPVSYFVPGPDYDGAGGFLWRGTGRTNRENLMEHALDVIDLIIGGEYPYATLSWQDSA